MCQINYAYAQFSNEVNEPLRLLNAHDVTHHGYPRTIGDLD